jgi:putative PIG3 family NAD(P)H quinone oxidoreductase
VPGAGQVLIRVAATSVNRPDIVQREGNYPPPPGESDVLGLECAGTVEALGDGVESPVVGDRVLALLGGGGYAEQAVASAGHVVPIPENMSFEQAACVAETYITAWLNLFGNGALGNGETVLLHGGGGGVATAAMQLVAALCPQSPIVVTASSAKADRVRDLGADLVIDYRAGDFVAAVRDFTKGRGADVILDHIGAAYLEKNLASLAVDGRLVVIGVMQGSKATLNLGRLMVRRQRIIGSVLRPRPAAEKQAIIDRFSREVMPLFASGTIAPVIDSRFRLENAAEAHRRMEAGEHFGKIVLTVDS